MTELLEGEYLPNIKASVNPVSNETAIVRVPVGSSIADILGELDVTAKLNGVVVPKENWDYVLKADDALFIYSAPKGDAGKGILAAVVLAAVAFYAPQLLLEYGGTALTTTTAGVTTLNFAGNLLVAGIVSGTGYLVSSLITPHMPSISGTDATQAKYLSGSRNINPIGNPVPKVYGTFRFFPPLASSYYTENAGEDQYMYLLLSLGYAPLKLGDLEVNADDYYDNGLLYWTEKLDALKENIEIGGTRLSAFDDVLIEIGNPSNPLFKFRTNIVQQNPSRVFEGGEPKSSGWDYHNPAQEEYVTTPPNTKKVSIDLAFPRLFSMNENGRMMVESDYNIETIDTAPYLSESPTLTNRVTAIEWPAVDFKVYYAPKGTEDWTLASTDEHIAGYSHVYRKWKGRYYDDPNTPPSPYIDQCWRINRNTKESFIETFEFDVPEGEYDVKLVRVRTNKSAWAYHESTCTWVALRCTLSSLSFNVENTVCLGLKIKASDQLNGIIDNLSIEVSGKYYTETDSGWTKADNGNPAYAFLDTLKGVQVLNKVPESRIDRESLERWYAFCEDNNIEYNAVHDKNETVIERLRSICATGFASLSFVDGKFGVVLDTESEPVGIISPRNSWGFSSTKTYREVVEGVRVKYIDKEIWTEVDRLVPNDGYTTPEENNGLPVATKVETLDTVGITDSEQAWKYGRYHLAQYDLRPEVYRVSMGIENIHFTRGDVVHLSYDTMLVGQFYARVREVVDATKVILDQDIVFEEGSSYVARFRLGSGSTPLFSVSAQDNVITCSAQHNAQEGDLIIIGEAGSESILAKITDITHNQDMTANISLVDAAPNIFDAWSEEIPEYSPTLSIPVERRNPPAPEITSIVSDSDTISRNRDGTISSGIKLAWTYPQSNVPLAEVIIYAYVTKNGSRGWHDTVKLSPSVTSYTFTGLESNTEYNFSIVSVSQFGNQSPRLGIPFSSITTIDTSSVDNMVDFLLPLLKVSGLELKGQGNSSEYSGRDPQFVWRPSSSKTTYLGQEGDLYGDGAGTKDNWFKNYVVAIYDKDGNLRREDITYEESYTYSYEKNVADGRPVRDFTIKVWTESDTNHRSASPAVMDVTNPLPILNANSITTTSTYNSINISYQRPTDIDYEGVVLAISRGTAYEVIYYGDDASILVGDLEKNTEYTFKIAAYDAFSAYTPEQAFPFSSSIEFVASTTAITSEAIDTTPPSAPTGLALATQTFQTTNGDYSVVTVAWEASEDDGNISHYLVAVDEDGGDIKEVVADNTSTVFNAIAGRTYTVIVRAIDWAGNRSAYCPPQSIVAASDGNAPSPVSELSATSDLNKVILSWKNPVDIDFDKARVRVGESILWEGRADSFVHTMMAGESFTYSVTAIDYSGNESAPQAIVGASESIRADNIATYFQTGVSPVVSLSELPTAFISDVISYNSVLYRWDGTQYISSIDFSDIDNVQIASSQFEEGIEPVTIVDTLPASRVTQTVFLTTDSKLYRWDGSSYVNTVFIEDLDTTPPSTPTNLALVTTTIQTDNGDISLINATWDASVDNEGVSHYVVNASESGGDSKEIVCDSTSATLSVIAGRTYTIVVRAVDCFGNKSLATSPQSIVAASDSNPPSPVTNLVATPDINRINFSWNNPTDIDYKETVVKRGATEIWRGRGTSFSYSMEPYFMPVVFEVYAVDYSGNESSSVVTQSNSVQIGQTNIDDYFVSGTSPVVSLGYIPTSLVSNVIVYSGEAYRWNGTGYTKEVSFSDVSNVEITSDLFAPDIEPVTVVSTLPTSKLTETVFLSSDKKIYRWDGSTYTRTTPFSDLEGYISASQIEANSISTNRLTADWLDAGAIAAGAISANELNVDSVLANAILAQNITATGTITGATLQTSVSGARVVMDDEGIVSYNASEVPVISILTNGSVEMGKKVQYDHNIPNASFAEGLANWTVVSDNGYIIPITNDGYSDSYCVKMKSNSDSSNVTDGVYIVGQEGIVANGNFQMSFRTKVNAGWAKAHIGVLAEDGNGTQAILTKEYHFTVDDPFELSLFSFDIKDYPELSGIFDNPSFKLYPLFGNSRIPEVYIDDVSLSTKEVGGIKLSSDGSIGINLAGDGVFTSSLNGGRVEINPKDYPDAIIVYDNDQNIRARIDESIAYFSAKDGTNGIHVEGYSGILAIGETYGGRFEIDPNTTDSLTYGSTSEARGGSFRIGSWSQATASESSATWLIGSICHAWASENADVLRGVDAEALATGTVESTSMMGVRARAIAESNTTVISCKGVESTAQGASVNYDFYAAGTGTYSPFTGSHDGLINKELAIEVGDIVADTDKFYIGDISNTISIIRLAGEKDKGAIGVYVGQSPIEAENSVPHESGINALKNITTKEYEELAHEYNIAIFNALGEGMINVCGWNGDIEAGDLLVSSPLAGKGMKQDDDIIRGYTVAKARQRVTFTSKEEVKMIPCIYLCG